MPTTTAEPYAPVRAWGGNWFGQLGDGSLTHQSCENGDCSRTPVRVDLTDAIAISSGNDLTAYALTTDGIVWAWGYNGFGQLGDGRDQHQSCGQDHDCSFSPVHVTGLSGVIAISNGYNTAYALKADGTVWAWGSNEEGQLGDGNFSHQKCRAGSLVWDCSSTPVQVAGLTDVTAISGSRSAYALKADGTVWAWGLNNVGQLGDGSGRHQNCPTDYYEYLDCSSTAVQVAGLSGVTAISNGGPIGYALKADGTVWAWGSGGLGQLGDGNNTHADCGSNMIPAPMDIDGDCSPTPVQVVGLSDVTAISSRDATAYALKADGTVWSWGNNTDGQLGDGNSTHSCPWQGSIDCSTVPVQATISDVHAVVAGTSFAYAVKRDGTVWTWGENPFGAFGPQSAVSSLTAVQVVGLERVVAIRTSWQTNYVLYRPDV